MGDITCATIQINSRAIQRKRKTQAMTITSHIPIGPR